jgi:hypothetical protein
VASCLDFMMSVSSTCPARARVRTYFISQCPCREEDQCSQGRNKPRFLGSTEECAKKALRLHLENSGKHYKSIDDAIEIADGCIVDFHDAEVEEADSIPTGSSEAAPTTPVRASRRLAIECPRPSKAVRYTATAEFASIIESTSLAVAAARHAEALAKSASIAFGEQAEHLQHALDKLQVMIAP